MMLPSPYVLCARSHRQRLNTTRTSLSQNLDPAAPDGQPQSAIGVAHQRRDGWLALETPLLNTDSTAAAVSDVRTVPLVFEGDGLYLNVDTGAVGSLTVELLDPQTGEGLPGFEVSSAVVIVGNSLQMLAEWRNATAGTTSSNVSRLAGRAVVVRFVATACKLFAFHFNVSAPLLTSQQHTPRRDT